MTASQQTQPVHYSGLTLVLGISHAISDMNNVPDSISMQIICAVIEGSDELPFILDERLKPMTEAEYQDKQLSLAESIVSLTAQDNGEAAKEKLARIAILEKAYKKATETKTLATNELASIDAIKRDPDGDYLPTPLGGAILQLVPAQ